MREAARAIQSAGIIPEDNDIGATKVRTQCHGNIKKEQRMQRGFEGKLRSSDGISVKPRRLNICQMLRWEGGEQHEQIR